MKKIQKFLMVTSPIFFLLILVLAYYLTGTNQTKLSIQSKANVLPTPFVFFEKTNEDNIFNSQTANLKAKLADLSTDLEKINFQDESVFPPDLDFQFQIPE
ncbi:MAG: hypothetical protein BWY24_00663 [Microgenomates group bacterium ADurb.Bin219]|nr:MAG: hypothetical protein BWY24_00663 [Microgenomates group bacterium ADurb.Bin219]HNP89584.1 hypothetical protein [Candidatus Woesebacteria bacterium]